MRDSKLRRQIAREAARLLFAQETAELFQARLQAQRRLQARGARPFEIPTRNDIAEAVNALAAEHPNYIAERQQAAADVSLLRFVRLFAKFRPRLECGPPLRLHLCNGSPDVIAKFLVEEEIEPATPVELEQIDFTLPWRIEITQPLAAQIYLHPFASWEDFPEENLTSWESISDLEQKLAATHPVLDLSSTTALPLQQIDRFVLYRQLLLPLEEVQQDPIRHPEGDALYHSLQVFALAKQARPYDEEFLLAALLHEVGKGIDPHAPLAAALEALELYTTERTRWFLEMHSAGLQVLDNTIGKRALRRLQMHPDYEDLLLLARCDRGGCVRGAIVPDLEESLAFLQQLAEENG